MSRGYHPANPERWTVILGNEHSFWQYATKPASYDIPKLLPNEASAKAYAAWLLEWASQKPSFAYSNKQALAVNVDSFDFASIPLSWPTALDGLTKLKQRLN